MDPRELTPEEAETLSDVTQWWKVNRDWLYEADILRLDSADPAVVAEQQTDRSAQRFVVFAGLTEPSAQIAPRPLRLTRLDPTRHYELKLLNRASASHLSRGQLALKGRSARLTGSALMSAGLRLPWQLPQSMWVVEGKAIGDTAS